MESKHTKGQWVKGTNTTKRDWMHVFCNGKMIAQVKELSKKGDRKATDFEEEGANVALIAAAPQLYNAAHKALLSIYAMSKSKQGFYQYLINDLLDAIQIADGTRINLSTH